MTPEFADSQRELVRMRGGDPDFVYRKQVIGNKVKLHLAVDPATQSPDDTIVVVHLDAQMTEFVYHVGEPLTDLSISYEPRGFSSRLVDRARAEREAVESRIMSEAAHLGGRGFAQAMAEYEAKMELLEHDLTL